MNQQTARSILGDWVQEDESLKSGWWFFRTLLWRPETNVILLDDLFTPDQLEAIAWWMRNKGGK